MLRRSMIVPAVLVSATMLTAATCRADEFIGPFPSWANVKTDFGAVGDGRADDTAAIQAALIAVRSVKSPKRVLYFPAGTYRITATLKLERISHHEPLGMSIAGEDPETTIIRWDGPAGQSMFLYDAWYASLSRLTFDGRGKAKTAIEHGPAFATANECADVIIKDVQFGIEAGQVNGIAETSVLRCRFYRCAKAAISIQNFNSLDWYIWDCWFEDCGLGATNEFGAGNFHVYRSTFLRSKDADISIRHTGYFSFMGNTSIKSKKFFHAKRADNWKDTETWGSQGTIQDNLILDPLDPTPIVIENNGPNMLVDNRIRARGNGPIVQNEPPADKADLICIGNTWTAERAIRANGRVSELDNTVVSARAIKSVRPVPVPFLVRAERTIIEVPASADGSAIQGALDRAAAMNGMRPVVHLPSGTYRIGRTLNVPAGSDLQLVGDGPENTTQLTNGGFAGPMIRIEGPSHATFRNFVINAGKEAVAIQIDNADQVGARVFGEQFYNQGFEYGFVSDGLKNARVELRDHNHNGMQVLGGGPETKTWVALFSGSSGRIGKNDKAGIHLYDVQNEGRLFVRDIWYEGGSWSLMNLKGSGEFAYHCGFVAPYAAIDENIARGLGEWEADLRRTVKPLEFDGFRGKVSFTLVSTNGADIRIKPPSADLKLYVLGFDTNRAIDFGGSAVEGQVVAEHMRVVRKDNGGKDAIDGTGTATPAFVREMLKPLREVKPQPLTALADDVTDVRFYRVFANGRNGVRVHAAGR